jgi:hypothetical protein
MSVPLAGDSAPTYRVAPSFAAPSQSNRKSAFIIISIALLIVVVGFSVSSVLLVRYIGKFTLMDRSHESLSWDGAPGGIHHTTYKNPAYGVTLTLPGEWTPSRKPTSYLCHLVASTHFSAVLQTNFPVLTPSIDDDATLLAKRYTSYPGYVLKGDEAASISGFPAHLLRLSTPRGVDLDVVMVKKWPVVYALSVAGPSDDSDDWKTVRSALPRALQIN